MSAWRPELYSRHTSGKTHSTSVTLTLVQATQNPSFSGWSRSGASPNQSQLLPGSLLPPGETHGLVRSPHPQSGSVAPSQPSNTVKVTNCSRRKPIQNCGPDFAGESGAKDAGPVSWEFAPLASASLSGDLGDLPEHASRLTLSLTHPTPRGTAWPVRAVLSLLSSLQLTAFCPCSK